MNNTPLRIVFAGTPGFSVPALQALLDCEHQVIAVLSQPDRPAGRGRKLSASPVKQLAVSQDVQALQPTTLRDAAIQQQLGALQADLMVVVAYGLILPQVVLDLPKLGCWNIHASLLPRWRGAAPIHRAILAGDEQTGVCIMQMDAGLDTGPVLSRAATPIAAVETTGQLHDRLAQLGAEQLLKTIAQRTQLVPKPQAEQGVSYAEKVSKAETALDWQRSALALERQVRAFNPWPVATATIAGERLRIWSAEAIDGSAPAGYLRRADASGLEIGTANGVLRITELQRAGSRRMTVSDFLNSNTVAIGPVEPPQQPCPQ